MKKFFLTLFSILTIGSSMSAQTVSVDDVEALPGETVAFAVSLSGGRADSYIAVDINAQFPAIGFSTTGAFTINSQWTGATGVVGDVDETGLATMTFSSAEVIPGTDVENLLTISFKVGAEVALGVYDVTLKKTLLSYGISDKYYADDVTFKVNVVSAHSVVLDENSTTAPENATGVNVHVKRTINANEWSTIVLPFAMTEAQVKAAFGDEVELGDFTGCETTTDADENITALKVNFNTVTTVEANHPYLIKVTQPIAEFTVEDVDITVDDELSVDKDEYVTGSGTKRDPYVYHYNSFVGTYSAETKVPELCLFLYENELWYSTGLTKMKAFRAYFDFYDVITAVEEGNGESRVFISFNDDTTTGISSTGNVQHIGNTTYNLHGLQVETPHNGLYIRNGKKVIIK